jgi:outer membrane beta-barrel protein
MPRRILVVTSILLLRAAAAFAQEAGAGAEAKPSGTEINPSDTEPPTAPCLTEDALRKGVQKRTFLKRHRLELIAQGGLFASDLLSSSYSFGGTLAGYFTEDFGLEVVFAVTPVALDVDQALTDFFHETRFHSGTGYLGLANALWSPIHYKVRTAGGSILHGDIEVSLGAGKLWNPTAQGFAFQGGLLAELYLTRWLSFRLDLRDVMLIQEVVTETRYTNNISVVGGLGLWFPFGF